MDFLKLKHFEKAFDSICLKFLYEVLNRIGFGPDLIKWIKILIFQVNKVLLLRSFKYPYKIINKVKTKSIQKRIVQINLFFVCSLFLLCLLFYMDKILIAI